jgi:hypothetical protein
VEIKHFFSDIPEELLPRIKEVIELCPQEEEPTLMVFEGFRQIEMAL